MVGDPELPIGKTPLCMQADGLAGGPKGQPGYCTFACATPYDGTEVCGDLGGQCQPVGELISHCVLP